VAGSIRKRPDKGADAFELRVFLGRDANGRVQHRSRLFHGTQRAAERALARLITTQEATPAIVPNEASRAWGPTTTINNAITGWKANGWMISVRVRLGVMTPSGRHISRTRLVGAKLPR